MAVDTGCTINLCDDTIPLADEQTTPNGIRITAASKTQMRATSKGLLPLNLPNAARECHRVPNLHMPLLSVGQQCDAGNTAIFNATKMILIKNQDVEVKLKGPPIYSATRQDKSLWVTKLETEIPVTNHKHQSLHDTLQFSLSAAHTSAHTKFDKPTPSSFWSKIKIPNFNPVTRPLSKDRNNFLSKTDPVPHRDVIKARPKPIFQSTVTRPKSEDRNNSFFQRSYFQNSLWSYQYSYPGC